MALRLLPGEIATDLLNGGVSLGYTAYTTRIWVYSMDLKQKHLMS